jgi:hypothetical protein
MTKNVGLSIFVLLFVFTGCASTPAKSWTSTPAIQNLENQYYEAQMEPLKRDHKFYVVFRLTVTNKTDKSLEIDWNKTRYSHNGRNGGGFVFKGIDPEKVKNFTIPPDVVSAGATFSKEIMPYKLLARAPIRDQTVGAEESSISPGILPAGKNGIYLVVRQNGKEVRTKIEVNIESK